MADTQFGFIGLGDMGGPMAANMARAGTDLTVYDKAGTAERAPDGTAHAADIADLVQKTDVVFLSVPDGPVSMAVARDIIAAENRRADCVINLSTVGIAETVPIVEALAAAGIEYNDAPVSGGRTGAIKATISLMWSGSRERMENLRPVLETFAKSVFFVGAEPGQGQTLKLINNYLSAVAMTATSEGIAFGLARGLDMKTMLDVINVSTGRNTATSEKFPNRILTETFDAGFRLALMQKDAALYHDAVKAEGCPDTIAASLGEVLRQAHAANPEGDLTDIYRFVAGR